jgi:hypothetical protein
MRWGGGMKDDEKNTLIEHRIARATDTIEEVSFLIKNKKFLLAVNRIYYGMFYILSALSLKYDFSTSKHQQLIGWFNKEFISTGAIDRKYGRICGTILYPPVKRKIKIT